MKRTSENQATDLSLYSTIFLYESYEGVTYICLTPHCRLLSITSLYTKSITSVPDTPLQYLDPYMQDPQAEHVFMVDLTKTYCSFHESSIKQWSVIICLLADRQPVLVQELLCWAVFNCSNNSFIMRLHQTSLAPAPWNKKWDAYLLLSTFWLLLLKSCPCSPQKLFMSI